MSCLSSPVVLKSEKGVFKAMVANRFKSLSHLNAAREEEKNHRGHHVNVSVTCPILNIECVVVTKYVQGVQRCKVYEGPCNNMVTRVGAT